MAKLIVLSDFSPPARSLWKTPRGVAAGDSAIYQRQPLSAASSRGFSLRNSQTIEKNPSASAFVCRTKVSAFLDISRAKLNLSNPIYLRVKFPDLPCLTLLCFALLAMGAPSVTTRCFDPRSHFPLCLASANNSTDLWKISCSKACPSCVRSVDTRGSLLSIVGRWIVAA